MPAQPPFRRRRLGRKLARMRADARMTLGEAAEALFKTKSALHRMEKGETLVDVHLVKSMMDLYDCYDPDLIEQTVKAREKGWWTTFGIENQGYIDVETEATHVYDLSPLIIPGLLQTPEYTRALFEAHRLKRTSRWLENDIEVRRIRQKRLADPEVPLRLHAIVHEAALRTVVGGPGVMGGQLAHLRAVAGSPNVVLQVLAGAAGIVDGMATAFTRLSFAEADEPDVLYIEYLTGALYIENEWELNEAKLTFEHVASRALGRDESVALIERIPAE
ncbi:helix-turn-helix domain-containing protein [Saccharothrix australiensis]|uniref:Helix-turn-helix protein n=1 Tax=Saccharothrix australiensis TaxID=2072 RepID=A0A495VTA9_9PSEU|nr:helix-turn-helix transcriptional regulator [Saccharothrix australiensis]RKT51937.1 helix-turn-helix protein [Saccharothrix australiensis]